MAESKILKCTCQSEYQDSVYGKGNRVMNPYGKSQDSGYRCTVCGREGGSATPKKK